MSSAENTKPWTNRYTVEHTEIVVETPELRMVRITLAPGQAVPWHWHTDVTDRFVCLIGSLCVESRAPRARHDLAPGEECTVAAKIAHTARNIGEDRCRFLVIQGAGSYDYNALGD